MAPLPKLPLVRLAVAAAMAFAISCGPPPPSAQDTLPRLKNALDEPVSTPEQNKANSDLVVQVSELKHIEGMSREDVEQKLGKGSPCSEHPMCTERGFYEDDWYYEIGTQGSNYVRHRPALIVGFNRFGKVDRTFVLEVL
jgi:outer membrane protein assembly factor BamE (lipoprotein component of BamABCDE complex)